MDQKKETGAVMIEAPDGSAILARIQECETGKPVSGPVRQGSINMLIDRYDDALRSDLFEFIGKCPKEDLHSVRRVISTGAQDPNLIRAMINTADVYRDILVHDPFGNPQSSIGYVQRHYDSLRLHEKQTLSKKDYDQLKAMHLVKAVRIGNESSLDTQLIAEHMRRVEPAIPVIMAAASNRHTTANQVVEMAQYVTSNIEHLDRIVAAVRDRRGFYPDLLDGMLAEGMAALDDGAL